MKENNFSSRLSMFRQNKNMTQEELAEAIYTKKCTISAYETGKIDIMVSILRDIAKVLNTTAGYLMDGDEMGFDAACYDAAGDKEWGCEKSGD